MSKFNTSVYLLAGLVLAAGVRAQDNLTLFEATENPQERQTPVRQEQQAQRPNQPAFILKGTSRFGDSYTVNLESTEGGNSIRVKWRANSSAEVSGHSGFEVVDVKPGTVSLRLPNGRDCYDFPERGVECSSDGRIALLSLQNAQPIRTEERQPQQEQQQNENGTRMVLNPFSGEMEEVAEISEEERQARAERQRARALRLRNFEPPRIPDDEVPEGMRKVSTPFGDRLVPDNE